MNDSVEVIKGDLFESEAQTLVNTVNCVGVMGKGLALEFKRRYPGMYQDYVKRCKKQQVKLGEPYLFRGLELPHILNFPTKGHWRSVSRLEDIIHGLEHLEKHYRIWGITSLAIPSLGCQQGQLDWRAVLPMIYRHLIRLDIPVELYVPAEVSRAEVLTALGLAANMQPVKTSHSERLKPAWVALAAILDIIEQEPYHRPVGRIRFQKVAYFATELGLPTGLSYRRSSYGPFAAELKGILSKLVNNGIICEEPTGNMFEVKVGPAFRTALPIYQKDLEAWKPIMQHVADLFRYTSTKESEIAATVHFTAKALKDFMGKKPTEREVLDAVMMWKLRRNPPLDEREVAIAIRDLAALHWIDVAPSDDMPIPEEPAGEPLLASDNGRRKGPQKRTREVASASKRKTRQLSF
ncbi:MAG: Appr-1-p processing protein [Syntrophomonadaceae bacterium]|nr:Appr-1-p processing protein [Syntrophomonadaceae bacterium]